MKITYTKTALKQLKAIAPKASKQIRAKVEQFAENPASLKNQVKKLKGSTHSRLRIGNYRVIFNEDGTILTVIKVGHRKNIYN